MLERDCELYFPEAAKDDVFAAFRHVGLPIDPDDCRDCCCGIFVYEFIAQDHAEQEVLRTLAGGGIPYDFYADIIEPPDAEDPDTPNESYSEFYHPFSGKGVVASYGDIDIADELPDAIEDEAVLFAAKKA